LVKTKGAKLYLLIDEYDNFLNEVLVNYGEHSYMQITHGTGFIRDLFKKIKDMTQEYVIDRIFITGVTPMAMNDVTSGFNIGTNISISASFSHMTGVTSEELEGIVAYYIQNVKVRQEVKEEMLKWYNGYNFNLRKTEEKIYNTTLVWYYMLSVFSENTPPVDKIDPNLMTDFGKLRFLLFIDNQLNGNFSIIHEVLEFGNVVAAFKENFFIGDDLRRFDSDKFISLLYYLGLLTFKQLLAGSYHFTVPNLVTEEMLWEHLREGLSLAYRQLRINVAYLREEYEKMALEGHWRDVFEYILQKFYEVASVRDFIFREEGVKMFFLAYLQMSNFYIIRSESEQSQGFADIYLEPKYKEVQWRYLIEFKYVKSKETDNWTERDSEIIEQVKQRARDQLERYAKQLADVLMKCIAVVVSSQKVIYMEEVERDVYN